MAKFLTFYSIGSMSGDNAYLGLSPDSVKGRVISTLDPNIVFRLELSNQKQIQSWTPRQKLSHKVVYDFKSQKYVGVFDNRKLGCWGEETREIEKGKIKLPRQLQEIVSFDDRHTILVYVDGTCESLENRVNGRPFYCLKIVTAETQQISRIECFNTRDNRVIMTYFVRNKNGGGMVELVYFLLNDDDLTPVTEIGDYAYHKIIEVTKDESKLSAFFVVEGDPFPSVMKIESDKRIYMQPLTFEANKPSAPSEFGAHSATFNCLRVDRPLTIVNVSTDCIAIYGGNTKEDGALLVLYNTVHFTVVDVQQFKVHMNNCRLWAIGKQYILMADGQRLLCARFRISQGKLSEAIGSKRSIEWDRQVNKECVNEEHYLEEMTSFVKAAMPIEVPPKHKQFQEIYNGSNQAEVFDSFEDYLTRMYRYDTAVDFIQGGSADDVRVRSVVHPNDDLYSTELTRMLSDFLEDKGSSETEITEHVIPILIKAKQPSELVKCIRKYTNVSERMLAKCLKYFLSMPDSDDKLAYINQVFACSFQPELIKEHLRTDLNLDDAIYLLDIIHRDLVDDELSLEEAPQYEHNFDSDVALMNWFVVILEAHYQQFLLSRDSTLNDFILKWKELIESFVRDVRDLKPITAKLVNILSGKFKQNDNPSSKWYSVEKVKLY